MCWEGLREEGEGGGERVVERRSLCVPIMVEMYRAPSVLLPAPAD
jgi:hypothetical protein